MSDLPTRDPRPRNPRTPERGFSVLARYYAGKTDLRLEDGAVSTHAQVFRFPIRSPMQ